MKPNLSRFTTFLLFLIDGGSFAHNIGDTSNKVVLGDRKFAFSEMSTVPDGQTGPPSRANGSESGSGSGYGYGTGSGGAQGGGYGATSGSGNSTGGGSGGGSDGPSSYGTQSPSDPRQRTNHG
ncbi:hypothetical protein POTOM_043399 [Populus tomentosa]|uniref:Uncharacterized protein n=1 Tax=Populus tomentosa TaxID=118781 RepID=A0A8X8CHA4_POPTO|nr:hypothetical protein POTOM_043399 [Populus tomentosa]